jgi:hypothetical protein
MPAGNIHITQTTELPPSPPGVDAASGQPLPQTYALGQNYPNPFNPSTVIRYNLPAARVGPTFLSVYHVSLRVYNLLGQVVATLIDDVEESGYKSVSWDAATLPSGVYFYRLEANAVDNPANSFSEIRKMLTIK